MSAEIDIGTFFAFNRTIEAISRIVKSLDSSTVYADTSAKDSQFPPLFGDLTSEKINNMDIDTKVLVFYTMSTFDDARQRDRLTWQEVESLLMQNPMVQVNEKTRIDRADRFIKEDRSLFKLYRGAPSEEVVKEVNSWFTKLVNDKDVINTTRIDINALAQIVSMAGATINGLKDVLLKRQHVEKTLFDFGVLSFPDTQRVSFKMYRIKMTVWANSSRIGLSQSDSNGISGEYYVRQFHPRPGILPKLPVNKKREISVKLVAMLSSLPSIQPPLPPNNTSNHNPQPSDSKAEDGADDVRKEEGKVAASSETETFINADSRNGMDVDDKREMEGQSEQAEEGETLCEAH